MIWASNYSSRLNKIIILQKRVIRIIRRLPYNSHTDQAFAYLGILKLHQIQLMQTAEFMHRYTNRELPNAFDNYFDLVMDYHSYPIRNPAQYRGEFARTNTRSFAIKIAGPSLWNSLPQVLRDIPSRPHFKRELKLYIMKQHQDI